jgi:hypothetical protein
MLRQFAALRQGHHLQFTVATLRVYGDGITPGVRVLNLMCNDMAQMQANDAGPSRRKKPKGADAARPGYAPAGLIPLDLSGMDVDQRVLVR